MGFVKHLRSVRGEVVVERPRAVGAYGVVFVGERRLCGGGAVQFMIVVGEGGVGVCRMAMVQAANVEVGLSRLWSSASTAPESPLPNWLLVFLDEKLCLLASCDMCW